MRSFFPHNALPSQLTFFNFLLILGLSFTACAQQSSEPQITSSVATHFTAKDAITRNIDIWPALNMPIEKDPSQEKFILSLVSKMTLEQKVAQMIQPEIRDFTVADMRRYGFGSYLNGGGGFPNNNKHATPQDWVNLAEKLYQASIDSSVDGINIPTMWGTDAVHGHNNVTGATLFPHNIGLGAANNPQLIEQVAAITAKEVLVTGIDWVFAPTVAVVRNDRWGRSYEGYSEDPEIVRSYSSAVVKGLQGHVGDDFLNEHKVISSIKHFLGDGGTVNGDDQGNNVDTEQQLFTIHGQGYVGGLTAGSQTVMASFNSWHGEKIHGNQYLLTDVLKQKMGFDGFVVGDWNGHGQIPGCSNDNCSQTINAGLDMFMVPTSAWKTLLENTIAQVNRGEISMSRIDDAVSRILRVKVRAGLFDKPSPANRPLSAQLDLIGHPKHRQVARQAVRESLVLLKNNNNLLPIKPTANILVAGDAADNIGKQSGGWSVTWQGTGNVNADFPGATSIYSGLEQAVTAAGGNIELAIDGEYSQRPDVAIVVFGEEPYAEGVGDIDDLNFQATHKTDLALLKKLKQQGIKVVSVFISGRPMWVNAELNASDAFVAAWLPGTEGNGVADVLLSKPDGAVNFDFKGRLSFSWPNTAFQTELNRHDKDYAPLLSYGFGLQYGETSHLKNNLNEFYQAEVQGLTNLAILDGSIKSPFVSALIVDGVSHDIDSSIVEHAGVKYRTEDWKVQEDSLHIQFSGDMAAEYRIYSKLPDDLRSYGEANAILNFSVQVHQEPSDKVYLGMLCASATTLPCKGVLDISKQLTSHLNKDWQQISVPLKCFADQGLNLAKVSAPFSILSKGHLELSISNIYLGLPATIDIITTGDYETNCSFK